MIKRIEVVEAVEGVVDRMAVQPVDLGAVRWAPILRAFKVGVLLIGFWIDLVRVLGRRVIVVILGYFWLIVFC